MDIKPKTIEWICAILSAVESLSHHEKEYLGQTVPELKRLNKELESMQKKIRTFIDDLSPAARAFANVGDDLQNAALFMQSAQSHALDAVERIDYQSGNPHSKKPVALAPRLVWGTLVQEMLLERDASKLWGHYSNKAVFTFTEELFKVLKKQLKPSPAFGTPSAKTLENNLSWVRRVLREKRLEMDGTIIHGHSKQQLFLGGLLVRRIYSAFSLPSP